MSYGPKVRWDQLLVGVRVYYTGDMANASGYGAIVKRHTVDPKWGYQQVDIQLDDDGHLWRGVHLTSFQPSPGKRFWLEADYKADRERRIAEMCASFPSRASREG